MDDATRADMQQWTGCVAGALTREYERALTTAGLGDVEIRETDRVHQARRLGNRPRTQAWRARLTPRGGM
jgi:hypothetical protein